MILGQLSVQDVSNNIVEFTPTESDVFSYICWMVMMFSSITVLEADEFVPVSLLDSIDM
jgi:hypothetical protein